MLLTHEIDRSFGICHCYVCAAGAPLLPADYKQPTEFGPGALYLETPEKAADRKRQTEHIKAWPIDRVRPYRTPNFTAASGPVPTRRFQHHRYRSPLNCFGLFFDADVYELLLTHTNINGHQKYADWVDCDRLTLMALIGTLIRMACMPAPDLADYWHSERGWDPVRTVWSRNRFTRLLWTLHTETGAQPHTGAVSDRLWDVQPLNDLLNDRFAAALRPPRDLVCDETMVAYRGEHDAFRRMENKPISRGFLIWKLACRSGYVYRQLLCYGASGKSGVMKEVVLSLVNPYLGEHRVVYFDSAFTSIDLLLTLWNRHTYAVGKVHPIRVFPYHVRHATLTKDGFVTVQHRDCVGLSATACNFNDWHSELLSTATDLPMATVHITPRHSTQSYPAPAVLQQYNAFCGGVDEANRLAAFRALHRKHYRAYMTFFEHFVNVAMSNAWIVYDQWARHHAPGLPLATYSDFMWQLSTELIGTFTDRQRPAGRQPLPHTGVHRHYCPPTIKGHRQPQQRCSMCFTRAGGTASGHQTTWRCTCGVAVCDADASCWPKHVALVRASVSGDH